eukprot:XP_011672717.1 PREDICTED: uncharacterized protein LOC105442367 [Strongylocentrotus purpuratus]
MQSEEGLEFQLITITVSQVGNPELSRSLSFFIRYRDEPTSPIPTDSQFVRQDEELPQLDLSDIGLNNIAEEITVDQYYDLGVALGFNIHQLDNIEYYRFRNRKQATYDMLVRWTKGQRDGQEAKRQLLILIESVGTPVDQIDMQEIELDAAHEIPDKTLVTLAGQMKAEQFYDIGQKLGIEQTELEHIKYRTLSKMKDATIQMFSK